MKKLQGIVIGVIAILMACDVSWSADVVIIENLIWQKVDDGVKRTWDDAAVYCESLELDGYSNWRLPNKDELKGIVYCSNGKSVPLEDWDYTQSNDENLISASCGGTGWPSYNEPTINSSLTCSTDPSFGTYNTPNWSSTVYPDCTSADCAWFINFGGGVANYTQEDSQMATRCVHDAPAPTVTIGNLMWQYADNGQRYNWPEANAFCEASTLSDYSDWRLPTNDELKGLVVCSNGKPSPLKDWDINASEEQNVIDAACGGNGWGTYTSPCIDTSLQCPAYAPGTWSSSSAGDGLAWNVHFTNGNNYPNDKLSYIGLVRCVRKANTTFPWAKFLPAIMTKQE